ncbi:MAG: DeoR/GlpR family DNA-binding transcription regulator [Planctomycetota bacterium]
MLPHERQQSLTAMLESEGRVVVSHVARTWGVSEMTVRRDLRSLEQRGVVARIHGGAVAGGGLRWNSRAQRNRREKTAAAAKLVAFLPPRGCIYLDGSTTVVHLVDELARRGGYTVATNNIDTFQRLTAHAGLESVLVGGALSRGTDNFVGPLARRCLDGIAFTAGFFSAYALHNRFGCSEPAIEDAEVKQLVGERCERIHLAVNHHKLGQQAAGTWDFAAERAVLATDLDPGADALGPYRPLFTTIV